MYVKLALCAMLLILTLLPQAVGDDISYIQSQNRGLQVQTQNQRALLSELENLLVIAVNFTCSCPELTPS